MFCRLAVYHQSSFDVVQRPIFLVVLVPLFTRFVGGLWLSGFWFVNVNVNISDGNSG